MDQKRYDKKNNRENRSIYKYTYYEYATKNGIMSNL